MTLLLLLLGGALFFLVVLLACAQVSGRGLSKCPTPFLCWACGNPHTDTTLCCRHCQEVTA